MQQTFRDTLRLVTPPWLQRTNTGKVMYSIALHCDGMADALVAGVKSRFPNVYSGESLPVLGRDRRIRRGRIESDETYGGRLERWLDDHRRRGGPYALLAQLHAHFAPNNFAIDLVYYSGRRYQMDVNGNVTRDDIVWTPDDDTAKWARWWLFYHWPTAIGDGGTWGDGDTWGSGSVWGSALTVQDVSDLRSVPREWNAAHALGRLVLLPPGARLWGYPESTWGDGGTWGAASPVELSI